ncbi:MAG: hypothetical protein LH615_10910 [Ferruginibacter sp.]|nr:hypothetical protein [Ferruginibacter sp.]
MKNILVTVILSAFINVCFAQRIGKVTINGMGATDMITIATDDNAVINISPDGNVISYGTEYFSEKIYNYSRLEKFNGRIDLYIATDDKLFLGRLKYIGRTAVIYYASYDIEALRGKIKSVGTLLFNYYMQYDDATLKGKIKSIGSQQLAYFTSFDNEALRGKLKTLGTTNLNYYTSFDDRAFAGKIKSIGQINFTYYPSYDKQFAGGLKTGSNIQNVAGINYFIQ